MRTDGIAGIFSGNEQAVIRLGTECPIAQVAAIRQIPPPRADSQTGARRVQGQSFGVVAQKNRDVAAPTGRDYVEAAVVVIVAGDERNRIAANI